MLFAQDSISKRFAKSIEISTLQKHVYLLASDSLEGRGTGQEGCEKASKYIANEFSKYGLIAPMKDEKNKRTFFQPFSYGTSKWKEVYAKTATEKTLKYKKDIFAINTNAIFQTPQSTKIRWIDANVLQVLQKYTYSEDEIILIPKIGKEENISEMVGFLEQKNVKGVILVCRSKKDFENTLENFLFTLDAPRSTLLYSFEGRRSMPIWFISPNGAEILLDDKDFKNKTEIQAKENITIVAQKKNKIDWTANNIIGYIRGKEKPNEFIVISAHYDHMGFGMYGIGNNPDHFLEKKSSVIYNGANDNASGTTGVLAIAEAFSTAMKKGILPKRSIVFIAFAGEELGLLGSKYFTDLNPIIPLSQIKLNLNVDMIGRSDGNHKKQTQHYICPVGLGFIYKDWLPLQQQINRNSVNIEIDYTYNKIDHPGQLYYRSDHFNFAKYNIPVIFYQDSSKDDYHSTTDDPEKIEYEKMLKRVQLIFHTAWEASNMNELPQK